MPWIRRMLKVEGGESHVACLERGCGYRYFGEGQSVERERDKWTVEGRGKQRDHSHCKHDAGMSSSHEEEKEAMGITTSTLSGHWLCVRGICGTHRCRWFWVSTSPRYAMVTPVLTWDSARTSQGHFPPPNATKAPSTTFAVQMFVVAHAMSSHLYCLHYYFLSSDCLCSSPVSLASRV